MNYLRALILSALAGAILGACQKPEAPTSDETLSVDPPVIAATSSLATYTVSVASNAHWTVTLAAEDGTEAAWAMLGRTSGTGNASVSVRVNENKYKDERKAVITFKTDGGRTSSVKLTQAGAGEGGDTPAEVKLRLGTYNLRRSGLTEDDANNNWTTRKDRLEQSILACAFDIVGFQEVDTEQQSWLRSQFGPRDYSFYFFSPYAQTGVGSRGQGVGYRTSMFTLVDNGFFWASADPDTMSQTDTGSSGNFCRGGCWVILQHKNSGVKIFFMDNHGCLNGDPNREFAHVYVDREKLCNPEGFPSVFVGDMNAGVSSTAGSVYMTYTSHWKDSYQELDATKRTGCAGTYNGYSNPSGKSRIDYVFVRGGITPLLYTCDNTLYGGLYASDHFPVYIDAIITK